MRSTLAVSEFSLAQDFEGAYDYIRTLVDNTPHDFELMTVLNKILIKCCVCFRPVPC
mgnify:CR=1 FL=1